MSSKKSLFLEVIWMKSFNFNKIKRLLPAFFCKKTRFEVNSSKRVKRQKQSLT